MPTGPANGSADGSDGGRNGPLFRWVVEHGRRVDPTLWQAEVPAGESDRAMPRAIGTAGPGAGPGTVAGPGGRGGWRGGLGRAGQLYDCRPEATKAASLEISG